MSIVNLIKLFLFIGGVSMILGCREYHLYHYEKVQDIVSGGEIVIEVVASRRLDNSSGKKMALEGNPYSLLFKFYSNDKFKRIEINQVEMTGNQTNNTISLGSSSSKDADVFSEEKGYLAIASFSSQLQNQEVNYEPYDLRATLLVHNEDGTVKKSQLRYQLKTQYKVKKRNDIIDGIMGI